MPRRAIDRFLICSLLWLGPMFAIWYLLAPKLLLPIAVLTQFVLTQGFGHAVVAAEQHGIAVEIVTRFLIAAPAGSPLPPGAQGQLVFEINALKYAYGLPLLVALSLAAPTAIGEKLTRAIVGIVMLLPVPVWGLACEALKVLVFEMGPTLANQMHTTALARELLAFAYQLGYLILPAVTPILIWAALHRSFLRVLLGAARTPDGAPGTLDADGRSTTGTLP